MDAGHLVSRQELLTRSRWQLVYRISRCTAVCCCEPEFDIAQLESRHDALDSFGTLGTRVPSPLAWGRNGVRELRAQWRHVLGDGGAGSIVTASPFSSYEYDRGTVPGEFSTAAVRVKYLVRAIHVIIILRRTKCEAFFFLVFQGEKSLFTAGHARSVQAGSD